MIKQTPIKTNKNRNTLVSTTLRTLNYVTVHFPFLLKLPQQECKHSCASGEGLVVLPPDCQAARKVLIVLASPGMLHSCHTPIHRHHTVESLSVFTPFIPQVFIKHQECSRSYLLALVLGINQEKN